MRTATRSTARSTAAGAVLGLAAVAALSACSTPAAAEVPGVTDEKVVIGTHQPLTGPAAAGFASISAATAAYFEYVNAHGGIHGREIEYVVKDDGYNPATTQTVVRELVQEDEVFAIVNGLGTPTHSSVLDYLDQNGVPDLFVASGSLTWNQPDEYPNTFGFNADYVTEGAALAQYALDTDPDAVVCVLGQDDDFGAGILQGVELVLGDGEVATNQTYSTADQDVTAQLGAMKEAGCTHNVLGTINGFTALAVGTAAQMEWFPTWHVSSSGADHPTLAEYLGEEGAPALEGLVSVNYLPNSPSSEWYELFSQINEEYNDGAPYTGNTTYGMSVGYQFAEALAAAGENPTRESIVAVVESGELQGNGIAPLTYSADDHFGHRTVRIAVVADGAQDFTDSAYEVSDAGAAPVAPEQAALVNEGIPATE